MGKKSKNTPKPSQVKYQNVLSIETSCDDTSVAIVSSNGLVRGMKSQNQDDVHSPHGGVIPELACRNHTMRILPLIEELFFGAGIGWSKIDGICVTARPGLLGSLLVGVTVAKTLSLFHGVPLIGVNHLEGHLYAPFLRDESFDNFAEFTDPFVGLIVSGGHTSLVHVKGFGKYVTLGRTLDDAAGEAFDKFGKFLGFGYPAGRVVDARAKLGNLKAFEFPRPLINKPELNFSFSGLKTAGALTFRRLSGDGAVLEDDLLNDLCASFQEAIVDVLISKLDLALKKTGLKQAVITGGVSCNSRLRIRAKEFADSQGVQILFAPPQYCTDNAAMIGFVGIQKLLLGEKDSLKLSALATSKNAEIA